MVDSKYCTVDGRLEISSVLLKRRQLDHHKLVFGFDCESVLM